MRFQYCFGKHLIVIVLIFLTLELEAIASEPPPSVSSHEGGQVLSGFRLQSLEDAADDEHLLGKVVEILPGSQAFQPAIDTPERDLLLRGIYLGDGRIQISGIAPLPRSTMLNPGTTAYLSAETTGIVVGADSEEIKSREFATRIGFVLPDNRVQLAIGRTITALNLVRQADRFPLKNRNVDFESDDYWTWLGGDNSPQFRDPIGCLTRHLYSYGGSGEDFGQFRRVYQSFELPDYLIDLVDEGRLYIRFGATIQQGTAQLWLRGFHENPGGPVSPHQDDMPGTVSGQFLPILEHLEFGPSKDCEPIVNVYQIRRGTRWLLVALGGDGQGINETRIDNVHVELTTNGEEPSG